jgi:3D (Asp-Asp-Asp) domain-containing protein
MTRFIFSSVMVLVLLAGIASAHAAQNSKHPISSAVMLAQAAAAKTGRLASTAVSTTATTAANAVAALDKAARMSEKAMDEEMVQAARKIAKVAGGQALGNGLARLTAYWCGEDHYTRAHISATGVRLHSGHCAVDPSVIPFGSVVQVQGIGTFLAVDTGTAVISRRAARESGHSKVERHALVIDLFFEHRSDGEKFAANGPKYAAITWWPPQAIASDVPGTSAIVACDDNGRGKSL